MYFVDRQTSLCFSDLCWQGHVDAWPIRINNFAAWSSERTGPSYSFPNVSCSARSAGVIDCSSDSNSAAFSDPIEILSSDNSLRSESDSELMEFALSGICDTIGMVGVIACALLVAIEPAPPLPPSSK